jgi:hypothetical protein
MTRQITYLCHLLIGPHVQPVDAEVTLVILVVDHLDDADLPRFHEIVVEVELTSADRWISTFPGHESAFADLKAHSEQAGGIARSFIHTRAHGDPVELFLMAMAWGYRPKDYGPARTLAVLDQDGADLKIAAIVEATRTDGAAAGWHALLNTHKITGLNMSFGTKLLYFAGYTTDHRPRPLILDQRVRASLNRPDVAPGTVPPKPRRVQQDDYVRYLELAEAWAAETDWNQEPDVVEFALFTG